MRIMSAFYMDGYDDEGILDDLRVKIYNDFIFCSESDYEDLEKQYDIKFYNFYSSILEVFDEVLTIVFDLKEMVISDINLGDYNDDIFLNDFPAWILVMKNIILDNLEFIIKNYDECERNFYNALMA